jgi:hypothetical protein
VLENGECEWESIASSSAAAASTIDRGVVNVLRGHLLLYNVARQSKKSH